MNYEKVIYSHNEIQFNKNKWTIVTCYRINEHCTKKHCAKFKKSKMQKTTYCMIPYKFIDLQVSGFLGLSVGLETDHKHPQENL